MFGRWDVDGQAGRRIEGEPVADDQVTPSSRGTSISMAPQQTGDEAVAVAGIDEQLDARVAGRAGGDDHLGRRAQAHVERDLQPVEHQARSARPSEQRPPVGVRRCEGEPRFGAPLVVATLSGRTRRQHDARSARCQPGRGVSVHVSSIATGVDAEDRRRDEDPVDRMVGSTSDGTATARRAASEMAPVTSSAE